MSIMRMQGVAAVSVNWGPWAGSGMAEAAGIERMQRMGFSALQPAAGLAVLGSLLAGLRSCVAQPAPQLMASVILWDRYGMSAWTMPHVAAGRRC